MVKSLSGAKSRVTTAKPSQAFYVIVYLMEKYATNNRCNNYNTYYMTHRQQRVGIEQKTTKKHDSAGEFFL